MLTKRMRVFAGPNGSGKTTIFKQILVDNQVDLGVYVNADDIELSLSQHGLLDFSDFQLSIVSEQVESFFRMSEFSPVKRKDFDLWKKIKVDNNVFTTSASIDSYLAADLAEFIRQALLKAEISFTYETVLSHKGKIDFLKQAIQSGYRVYLYYIATEDPEINIGRVNIRVAQSGHSVPPEVIKNRYYKSLRNLKAAVKNTNRAFIFDNSQRQAIFIAEILNGEQVLLNDISPLPGWVAEYLLKDSVQ
jgi:predicted ABC-type ATPase